MVVIARQKPFFPMGDAFLVTSAHVSTTGKRIIRVTFCSKIVTRGKFCCPLATDAYVVHFVVLKSIESKMDKIDIQG